MGDSGYLLALSLMLPLNAWLVQRIGAKRLYIICFSAFTFSSVMCALSWSANSLIEFRILQGMSGGLMAPLARLTIARTADKNFMRVVGYLAVPVLPGPVLGPVIAGAILQHPSWHWLFLINLPIGVLAAVLAQQAGNPNSTSQTDRNDRGLRHRSHGQCKSHAGAEAKFLHFGTHHHPFTVRPIR